MTAGDYDNDGFVDLYVTRLGFYTGDGALYHNNGDGTFTDVTKKAGVQHWGPTFTSAWVDYDCDGNLDPVHHQQHLRHLRASRSEPAFS